KAHALVAGSFVLVVTALLALLAIWLTRDNTERDLYEMTTSEALSGIQPQGSVLFRGVPVGKIELIGFDSKIKGNVLIRISVDRGAPLTKSVFATVASQGVTGLGFIQLDDTGESAERLVPNDSDPPRIPLRTGGFAKLLKQGEAIMKQVEEAGTRVNKLLSDDNQQAVSSAILQLSEAAGSINRIAKGLEPTVASLPKLSRDTTATLQSVGKAADEVNATAARLNAKGGPLDKLAEGGAALASGVETFSAGTLPKLGEVADETARAMRQLRRTVNNVDDNPQALIFGNGPPVPGPGEAGFSANGAKK
ncbi:MAG: Mammalian cell entry related protein, partial [Polaromonas sp.]|nr:Mammalian cell entry related protein [Polaromonas sp.]